MSNLECDLYRIFSPDGNSATDFLVWVAQEYGLSEPLNLLDVGIGTGQALPLYAERGWSVVGYEPDETFADCARADANNAEIITGGFLDIDHANRFDLCAAINAPFSYLLTADERAEAARRVHQALRPDGVFVLEVPNMLWFLRNKEDTETKRGEYGDEQAIMRTTFNFDLHEATVEMKNHYEVGERTHEKTHVMGVLKSAEIIQTLRAARFTDIQTYPNYDARQPARADKSLIIVTARATSD